ncbi:2-hydroxyacid dehydrogenase [Roseateles sp.]|uniref:2-hydroxyacid dehydrogenase n=1 Tax=Roseateles sp. TaxID=1971397 RepID=UPI003BA655EA
MSIVLSGRWPAAEQQQWLRLLQEALPGEDWCLAPPADAVQAAAVDIAIVANPEPGVLQGLPNLRLIQSLWAGVDRLLQDPTLPPEVPLARMVDPAMNEAMVHTALWAVLALHRGFFDLHAQQGQSLWRQPQQLRAAEWRVMVLGMGQLGGRVAQALAAQGYAVSGWSRRPADCAGVQTLHGAEGLAQGLAAADTVINLLPLTEQTRDFFNAARLTTMKRGACLVNLARGAHVVEDDLLAALDSGQLSRAVLDVFRQEPLPADHPFWQHPRVTVLPHCAAQTDPRSAAAVVRTNVLALRAGQPLAHRVHRPRGY